MKLSFGIRGKLFFWYFLFLLIFYGTILALYFDIHQIMRISESIVNQHYRIVSIAKKMGENLLSMEEHEKKYKLLRKKEYLQLFLTAKNDFENSLREITSLVPTKEKSSGPWWRIAQSYRKVVSQLPELENSPPPEKSWIPESAINRWIDILRRARADTEEKIVTANIQLNRRGRAAVRNGLAGLALSTLVGLVWSLFFAYSTIRPLKSLIHGIRSISSGRSSRPIAIRAKDEFGEVARAFNEMAQRLHEEEHMRADFISMLSHEIRTPLTSIRESVNMIAEEVMGDINDRQRKFLQIASSEIGRISELLNHLMQVTRLESQVIQIDPRPFSPFPMLAKSIERIRPAAVAKRIQIRMLAPRKLPPVAGDSKYLQQVLLNLLGNAVKFSNRNGRIELRAEPDSDKKNLKICVYDNGPGIPENEQKLIFTKYYRAKDIRDQMDGVGLGLNIAKHIVEAHHGSIWVKSIPGKGSIFCFTVPIA